MTNIEEFCQSIRRYLYPEKAVRSLGIEEPEFKQLCVCLDLLGDTELALDAFIESKETKNDGNCYLRIFGCLQALVVQQDAFKHLFRCFDEKYEPREHEKLKQIRDLRNNIIGHPTNKSLEKGEKAFSFIIRFTMLPHHFETLTYFLKNDSVQSTEVNLIVLINEQRKELSKEFDVVLAKLHKYN